MKKNLVAFCSMLILLCGICTHSFARIWRVNNTAGITADFTTAQAAHDAASAGDTIHFEPSSTSYGNLTISKQLVLVSLGSFLGDNPGLQYNAVSGTLNSVSVSTAGVVLMINAFSITINAGNPNTSILRCRISGGITLNNSDNTVIMNCVFNALSINSGSTGLIVKNNIIENYTIMDNASSGEFANNVISAVIGTTAPTFHNSIVKNNIFNKTSSLGTGSASSFLNNLAGANILPAGNSNQNSVTMATVFVNPNGNVDNHFVLQTTGPNPAQGAGEGGIDCGAFGGTSAFKLGLIPPIPSIYKLDVPTLPSGNTLNIVISTRSNN